MHKIFDEIKPNWHVIYTKRSRYKYFKKKWESINEKEKDKVFLFELQLYDFFPVGIINGYLQKGCETIGDMKKMFFNNSNKNIVAQFDGLGKKSVKDLSLFMLEFYPDEFEKSNKRVELKNQRKKTTHEVLYI